MAKLYDALLKSHSAIQKAIRDDSHWTTAEAEVEYLSTLTAVRQHFTSSDFAKALGEEYSLAQAKDNVSRRVYLRGSRMCLYSSLELLLSDSLRLSLRLRLSIGPIEPISGLSWPNFLHIKAHSQGHSRYFLDSQFYHFDCTQFDSYRHLGLY